MKLLEKKWQQKEIDRQIDLTMTKSNLESRTENECANVHLLSPWDMVHLFNDLI